MFSRSAVAGGRWVLTAPVTARSSVRLASASTALLLRSHTPAGAMPLAAVALSSPSSALFLAHARRGLCTTSGKKDDEEGIKMDAEAEAEANKAEEKAAGEEAAKPEELKKQLQESQEQVAALKDRLARCLADMENVRRIASMDIDRAKKFAASSFAKSLLDVADNLARATDAVPEQFRQGEENPHLTALYEGVKMTEKILHQTFNKHAIKRFRPEKGDKFDPNVHMATFKVPSQADEPNTIAVCAVDGYMIHERVLRPASVGVHDKAPPS